MYINGLAVPKLPCKNVTCTVGTPILNINILNGHSDPIAKQPSEYPPWLFKQIEQLKQPPLNAQQLKDRAKAEGRLLNRRELRSIRKAMIRDQNLNSASF